MQGVGKNQGLKITKIKFVRQKNKYLKIITHHPGSSKYIRIIVFFQKK